MSAPAPQSHQEQPPAVIAEIEADQPPLQGVAASGESVGTLDDVGVAVESRMNRLKRIGKPIASFFSVQIIVQILTMLSGLLLVRTMSKHEYAFYTVANTMQGTIGILCDSGIGSALTAIGGVVWQDRERFGSLIQTAMEFRRKFGSVVFLLVGPIMWWMLYSNGSGVVYATILSLIVLAGSTLVLTHGVLVVVPRLHGRISQLQNAELMLAALRLLLLGIAYFIWLNAAIAILVFALTLGVQNLLYRRWASADANLKAPTNQEDRAHIWKLVRNQAPICIFVCVQGQLFVFLLSIFGNKGEIANFGALGRVMIFFTIVNTLMTNVIMPRFARCQDKSRLKSMYFQIIGMYLFLATMFVAFVALFPHPVLWILGDNYRGLQSELLYMTLASATSIMVTAIYALNSTRGWSEGIWISVPITIAVQLMMAPFLNLGSIQDVALMTIFSSAASTLPMLYRAYLSISQFGQPDVVK